MILFDGNCMRVQWQGLLNFAEGCTKLKLLKCLNGPARFWMVLSYPHIIRSDSEPIL